MSWQDLRFFISDLLYIVLVGTGQPRKRLSQQRESRDKMVGRNNSVHGEERSRETNFRIGQFIGEYRNGEWLALAAPYIRQWGTCSTHDSVECSAAVVQGDALDVLI